MATILVYAFVALLIFLFCTALPTLEEELHNALIFHPRVEKCVHCVLALAAIGFVAYLGRNGG